MKRLVALAIAMASPAFAGKVINYSDIALPSQICYGALGCISGGTLTSGTIVGGDSNNMYVQSNLSGTGTGSLPASITGLATGIDINFGTTTLDFPTWSGNPTFDQTFNTEIKSLTFVQGMFEIRESPTLASLGTTEIRNFPDHFQVTTVSDLLTEVSLDGGATWTAANTVSPSTPEPGSIVLLLTGGVLLVSVKRRRN